MRIHQYNMRILTFALILAMLVSWLPSTVHAEESISMDITQITAPAAKAIIVNYDQYVSNVNANLGLPETVTVTLADGTTADVAVTWDTSSLDVNTLGTYSLPGTITLPEGATNSQNLTVTQQIIIREYTNLLSNPSFESGTTGWHFRANTTQVTSPVKDGTYAAKIDGDPNISSWQAQISYVDNSNTTVLADAVQTQGSGQYYFGIWAQSAAATTSENAAFITVMRYRNPANPTDNGKSTGGSSISLSSTDYAQSSVICDLPSDVTWVRPEISLRSTQGNVAGAVADISDLSVYLDHAELIPLNVTLPASSDVVECEEPEAVITNSGTAFTDLALPSTVNVKLASGSSVALGVTWSAEGYDSNTLGSQTIYGTLDLANTYTNPNNITAQITVVVKAIGTAPTIYFSTSGDDANDGLTPETPKQDVTQIPDLMSKGYNISLKRGDTWYLPYEYLYLSSITGTSDNPAVICAYGDEAATKPILAFMQPVEDTAWTDLGDNVYSADISDMTEADGHRVYRTFVNGSAFKHVQGDYTALAAEEFCDYDGTIYVKTAGGVPTNVELIPYRSVYPYSLYITNCSNLTIRDIHIKGGSASTSLKVVGIFAPTVSITFDNCDFTYTAGYVIKFNSLSGEVNETPVVANCLFDNMLSEAEGLVRDDSKWEVGRHEGVDLMHGVESAWIHHNTFRGMSHVAVEIEILDRDSNPNLYGVHNCVIEYNLVEGANASYARAFGICDATNDAGENLATFNVFRHNKCYDMTTSIHLFGKNNVFYSNTISYTHPSETLHKAAQPWAFDAIPWSYLVSEGNIVLNNTFYDVAGGIMTEDKSGVVDNNLYANNLIVNYSEDNTNYPGAINTAALGTIYVMNNGMYTAGKETCIYADGVGYTPEEANKTLLNYSGNIFADPKFETADLSIVNQKGVKQDFTLSDDSPYRYTGLSLNDEIYEKFPALKLITDDYTDVNGKAYLTQTPSIGAVSYNVTQSGKIVSVEEVSGLIVRTGTAFADINLPTTIEVTLGSGSTLILPVTWSEDTYQTDAAGTYSLVGTLSTAEHPDLDINGQTAACTVTAKDQLELVKIMASVNDTAISVPYNTALETVLKQLTSTVTVLEEGNVIEDLPITWSCESYDPSVPGKYTFVGTISDTLISNPEAGIFEVPVTVMNPLSKGEEILINPDFTENGSYAPWVMEWSAATNNPTMEVTTDAALIKEGESAAMIVNPNNRWGSLGQDVTDQVKYLGDGQYLFEIWMRALSDDEVIEKSCVDLQVSGKSSKDYLGTAHTNIGSEYVQFLQIFDIEGTEQATAITFHTSTQKTINDVGKSYVISGCSLIYLGINDAEAAVTLDKLALTWDTIKGGNESADNVTSALTLPTTGENGSTITWTSSNESIIATDGNITQGENTQTVALTATIAGDGYTDTVTFSITVPGTSAANERTVVFVSNGGTEVAPQFVNDGETVDKPADPSREGYSFTGWYSDDALTTTWNFDTDLVNRDLVLYAGWTDAISDEGYTASIAGTAEANVGESVKVNVQVLSNTFENFASAEVMISYDTERLTFNETASTLNGATVKFDAESGTLTLEDYGETQELGTGYTLVFTAKTQGDAKVTLTNAAFSTQEKAEKDNLTQASLASSEVTITITLLHNVTLDNKLFQGDATVEDGTDYTFSLANDSQHYDYGKITATIDGKDIEVVDNGDGTYTVANVTGKLVISGSRTAKSYTIAIQVTGEEDKTATATYGKDFTYTMPTDAGYTYSLIVKYASGNDVPYTSVDGIITIVGTDIIEAFTITVTKTLIPPTTATVTVEGTATSDVTYEITATPGADYTFTVAKDSKYNYNVSARNGDTELELTEGNNGSYSINGNAFKAGDTIVITVNKSVNLDNVTVTEYVTLDQAVMWLVRITTDKLDNSVFTYQRNNMFWSEEYGAYTYLVIASGEQPEVTAEDLAIIPGTATDVSYEMDVNISNKVDANDSQLVYNMYNAHYAAFTENVTIEKFLRADINGDAKINVEDAAAIINSLLT